MWASILDPEYSLTRVLLLTIISAKSRSQRVIQVISSYVVFSKSKRWVGSKKFIGQSLLLFYALAPMRHRGIMEPS